jgi:hypothetical protein
MKMGLFVPCQINAFFLEIGVATLLEPLASSRLHDSCYR